MNAPPGQRITVNAALQAWAETPRMGRLNCRTFLAPCGLELKAFVSKSSDDQTLTAEHQDERVFLAGVYSMGLTGQPMAASLLWGSGRDPPITRLTRGNGPTRDWIYSA